MSVLFLTQNIACTTDFKVFHGDFKTGTQFGKFPDCAEPLFGNFAEDFIAPVHKKSICHTAGTAYTSAELIEL